MATDLERLVVTLEARITAFEENLQKAGVLADQTATKIERRFERTESMLERMSLRLASAFLGLGLLRKIFADLDEGMGEDAARIREWSSVFDNMWRSAISGLQTLAAAILEYFVRPIVEGLDTVETAIAQLFGQTPPHQFIKMIGLGSAQSNVGAKVSLEDLQKGAEAGRRKTERSGTRVTIKKEYPTIFSGGQTPEEIELYAVEKKIEEVNKKWEEMKDLTGSIMKGVVDDIRAGANAVDIMTHALTKLEDKLIDLTEQKILDILFGTIGPASVAGGQRGGGILGSLIGDFFFPGRQGGGPVMGGRGYIVGERGPELFVPSTAGTVVPGSHVGNSLNFSTSIDARGSQLSAGQLRSILDQRDKQLARSVRSALPAMLADSQARGV